MEVVVVEADGRRGKGYRRMGMWRWAVVWLGAAALCVGQSTCEDPVENCDPSRDYFETKVDFRYIRQLSELNYSNTYIDFEASIPEVFPEPAETIKYRLLRCGCPKPDGDDDRIVISVPVKDVFIGDTVSLAMFVFDFDDGLDKVSVIPVVSFVVPSQVVRDEVDRGGITSLEDPETNVANLTELFNKDVVPELPSVAIVSPFGLSDLRNETNKAPDQAQAAEMKVLVVPETFENSMLARAEYVTLFGILIGETETGLETFREIESEYETTSSRAFEIQRRPSVMLNTPFAGSWSFAGGDTYTAALLRDANADYRYQLIGGTENPPLDFDEVIRLFGSADYWVNAATFPPSASISAMEDALKEQGFNRMGELVSVQCGNVFSQSKDVSEDGANNFFFEGVVKPHTILLDLVKILHPGSLPDHELKYYEQLPKGDNEYPQCPATEFPAEPPGDSRFANINMTAVGANRFEIEDVLYTEIRPRLVTTLGLQGPSDLAFRFGTVRTASTSAGMTATALVGSEERAQEVEGQDEEVANEVQSILRTQLNRSNITVTSAVGGSPTPTGSPDDSEIPSVPTTSPLPNVGDESGRRLSGGAIAGIAVGVVIGVIIIFALLYLFVIK